MKKTSEIIHPISFEETLENTQWRKVQTNENIIFIKCNHAFSRVAFENTVEKRPRNMTNTYDKVNPFPSIHQG